MLVVSAPTRRSLLIAQPSEKLWWSPRLEDPTCWRIAFRQTDLRNNLHSLRNHAVVGGGGCVCGWRHRGKLSHGNKEPSSGETREPTLSSQGDESVNYPNAAACLCQYVPIVPPFSKDSAGSEGPRGTQKEYVRYYFWCWGRSTYPEIRTTTDFFNWLFGR